MTESNPRAATREVKITSMRGSYMCLSARAGHAELCRLAHPFKNYLVSALHQLV